ncbi:MAG: aminodeoxychorismate/anthranilate synthase component II, partial [SAR202 cluster bacterium]|nr:aminodeoxychorismate/anthranilate synthase component II [SAR202 cluster bacterium]
DQATIEDIDQMAPERIVVSPGPCTPAKAGISIDLIRHFGPQVPVLGVCLGHQCIGEAYGGVVAGAGEIMHGKTSLVHHDGKGVFKDIPSPFEVIRYHSLAIQPDTLPADLEVTARTDKGIIMGVRHRKLRVEGVQFHPESIKTQHGKKLLKNFLEMPA